MNENLLTEMLWNREEAAVATLEQTFGGRLNRLAMRITGDMADAAECVNDTYLAAWNSIPPNRPEHLFAYLAKICRNLAFGILDRKNADKRSGLVMELTAEMEQCVPDILAQERMESRIVGELLNDFLATLKPECRKIFLRRYWYGDSVKETAEFYGISTGKVKTSLHRTREKLREFLAKEGITL